MIILTLRTDKPEAELGLYNVKGRTSHSGTPTAVNVRGPSFHMELAYVKWQAHLELSKTINKQIEKILNKSSISLDQVNGIVCFKGPGSFTGLRIGLSVANALAYSQNIPIVARAGKHWRESGIKDLLAGQNDKTALPKYGASAYTTKPHK